ncbi:MAG: hypothetical protein WCC48_17670, partial [Anaeromyxobacteraceae bacterium]
AARTLRRLGRAWTEALGDAATGEALLERELALGAEGRSEALRRLTERALAEVAWLVGASGAPLRRVRARGILCDAAARVRGGLLEELQAEAELIGIRANGQELLPPAEEWRAIARLLERYAGAVARLDRQDRRLAWEIVHPALSAAAVSLFNVHLERSIAHATFRFLAAEAEAVDDAENHLLYVKNQRCGW